MKCSCIRKPAGFTLVELLVVLAIVAVLLTIAVPRYFSSVDRAKETVLVENLRTTRDAIGKFFGDTGRYPDSLDELVQHRYLRTLPHDPVADSAETWVLSAPEVGYKGRVADLHSSAKGNTQDGRPYGSL
uniref:General secretion pathway gspg related transmembrane protein (Type II secretory pathway) n=2 Tax=Ralstonia syzygii TaxID=28097 RepID=G3ACA5_9RALS|nr:prepilin-type N-terminal cleavage/methylation domain-containing protein [Ralstonia syzygii]CCA87189.1 general secretion pathway gspg related transmembrane protein (Type II secretory pathway) [Ralstonia syzygii R24]